MGQMKFFAIDINPLPVLTDDAIEDMKRYMLAETRDITRNEQTVVIEVIATNPNSAMRYARRWESFGFHVNFSDGVDEAIWQLNKKATEEEIAQATAASRF